MGKKKIIGICLVDGCERDLKTRGLCPMHYHKWQRYGDPTVIKRPMVKGLPPHIRFWHKVDIRDNVNECWEWQGYCGEAGYGTITINRQLILAHRYAWEYHNKRAVQEGLFILHSCDNRKCVNPNHLREGTYQDNYDDMVERGRRYITRGSECTQAKLTEQDIIAIRQDTRKQNVIAQAYNLHQSTISNICNGKSWKHVV